MKKVVVTGGSGFIGTHLIKKLEDKNCEVVNIDLALDPKLDVRNLDSIRPLFEGVDTVFHLAALPSVPYSIEHPIETHTTNLLGTLNVLVAARDTGVKRVIFPSSSAVYGDQEKLPILENVEVRPKSPYALEKYLSEKYLQLFSDIYDLETVSLRYFNVYGDGQNPSGPYASAIPIFLKAKNEGRPISVVGSGEQTRDFVHISDVVRANILAAESEKVGRGEEINIATGTATSINKVAAIIGGPVEYMAPRIEVMNSVADVSRARELLGWKSEVGLEEGISKLL